MASTSSPRASRRWWILATLFGLATLLCFGWMATLLRSFDLRNYEHPRAFTSPVIALEFATSPADVEQVLGNDAARDSRREELLAVQRADVLFPLCYGGFMLLVAVALMRTRSAGAASDVTALRVAIGLAIGAVVADYAENAAIDSILNVETAASSAAFTALAVAARLKFALIGAHALAVSPALRELGRLGRFAAFTGGAVFLAMAASVLWPAPAMGAAIPLQALFWLTLLVLSARRSFRSQTAA